MTWLLIVGVAAVAIVLVVLLIGLAVPREHTATRRMSFRAAPATVFAAITDAEAFPSWRPDVRKVSRLPDPYGRAVWVEEGRTGRMTLAVERIQPPRLLVLRIADPDLPFGGTWTYEVQPDGQGGCTLTITENGEIYNPIFRFMARFVFGYEATMASYLDALTRKFS